MAKAKSKPRGANKYTPPAKSGAPGWIWLVAGIVIGSFIMFLMKLEPKKDIRPQPPVNNIQAKETASSSNKPKFQFTQILSGNEVPQQPLTEEQRKKLDGERAAALLAGKTPAAVPEPTPAPAQQQSQVAPTTPVAITTNNRSTPQSTAQATKPTQVASITPPTRMNFFLQVGSYPTKNGAESIRAQVIMTGQSARLETTSSNNKTWYRVLVGPFKSKEEATKAQKQLSNNGFNRTLLVPRKLQ